MNPNPSTQYLYQWLEIDKAQFLKNIAILQKGIHEDLAAVVKGNAYGHDLMTATQLFIEAGIRRFCTYHTAHAHKIKKKHSHVQVINMGPVKLDQIHLVQKEGIELHVWDASFLDILEERIENSSKELGIHLEVETGMYRSGLKPEDLPELIRKIRNSKNLTLKGICTHFSGADEIDNLDRVNEQYDKWLSLQNKLKDTLDHPVQWHGPNSAAGIKLDKGHFTFGRIGLLMYGFFPSEYSKKAWSQGEVPQPAIRFMGRSCGNNYIPQGKYTGYGKSKKAEKGTKTKILPIGYSDGFPRALSHQWNVKVRGSQLKTLGRVNMNMTIFESPPGDESVQQEITLIDNLPPFDWYEAADKSGRFIYELLTCLSSEIPRIVK